MKIKLLLIFFLFLFRSFAQDDPFQINSLFNYNPVKQLVFWTELDFKIHENNEKNKSMTFIRKDGVVKIDYSEDESYIENIVMSWFDIDIYNGYLNYCKNNYTKVVTNDKRVIFKDDKLPCLVEFVISSTDGLPYYQILFYN